MCGTCGCNQPGERFVINRPGMEQTMDIHNHDHGHHHDHDHHHHNHDHHHHHHDHAKTVVEIERDILHNNNLKAERNRGFLEAKNIFCLNLVSSPGSGKTSLLEATLAKMKDDVNFYIVEGDQQTSNDADRIAKFNVPVVQINTGQACHLDAEMVASALKELKPAENGVLIIENVGNLVCPALFDLGENSRVVIMSVTEGEDKPIKYPKMFSSSDICIINKVDLLPYVDFDMEKAKEYALRVNHHLQFFEVSATKGTGLDAWCGWLMSSVKSELV